MHWQHSDANQQRIKLSFQLLLLLILLVTLLNNLFLPGMWPLQCTSILFIPTLSNYREARECSSIHTFPLGQPASTLLQPESSTACLGNAQLCTSQISAESLFVDLTKCVTGNVPGNPIFLKFPTRGTICLAPEIKIPPAIPDLGHMREATHTWEKNKETPLSSKFIRLCRNNTATKSKGTEQ